MSRKTKLQKLEFYQVVAIVEETYEVDTRVEECHGNHVFEDTTLTNKKLIDLKIVVGDREIDILPKLSQEEIDILLEDEV